MKKPVLLFLSVASGGLLAGAAPAFYQCGFHPNELAGWELPAGVARVEAIDGAPALRLTVDPAEKGRKHFARRQINLAPHRGKRLLLTCEVKGENISSHPDYWCGAKLMLHFKTPGKEYYPRSGILRGSFNWSTAAASVVIPPDATDGTIEFGLEECSGSVWFRNLRLAEEMPPFTLPRGFRASYTDRVLRMPRMRGVMSPNSLKPGDLEELKRWNANLIRWQIKRNFGSPDTELDLEDYLRWFNGKLEELDRVLELCGGLGIKVLIDLHTPPGGWDNTKNMVMFYRKEYRDAFYAVWEQMARRYLGNPAVWGYDLVNEPIQTRPTPDGYLSVQYEAARRIRAIDPETPIIIESVDACSPETFAVLQPLPLANIIYQAHMYWPHAYTHQSINSPSPEPIAYPGEIDGVFCDRNQLRRRLDPVRQFERKYGAKIYIGEFSAVRYAPGAAQYLGDLISIFEEYGWDWSYHAFRESHYWSVELDAGMKPAETTRKKLLLKYFSQNRQPVHKEEPGAASGKTPLRRFQGRAPAAGGSKFAESGGSEGK